MVFIDSSAWIEFLRNTGSPAHRAVARAVADGSAATSDIVMLELLVGVAPSAVDPLTRLIGNQNYVAQEPFLDVRAAADIYHLCRRRGATPRSTNDCLIAALAIREDMPLLHCDRDFDVIAAHTSLQTVAL
jgi:predicted nucleic acid-binding protein